MTEPWDDGAWEEAQLECMVQAIEDGYQIHQEEICSILRWDNVRIPKAILHYVADLLDPSKPKKRGPKLRILSESLDDFESLIRNQAIREEYDRLQIEGIRKEKGFELIQKALGNGDLELYPGKQYLSTDAISSIVHPRRRVR